MKVAFAHYTHPGDISGVTTWVVTLARRLQEDGFEVGLFLLLTPVASAGEAACVSALRAHGVQVFTAAQQRTFRDDVKQVLGFLESWQPHVFLPQCKTPHYAAAALAGRQGLPWVLTLHSDDPLYWSVVRWLPPPRWGGRTVAVSRRIRERALEGKFDPRPLEIPYGVAIPTAPVAFHDEPFRVAYCGRLWEQQKRVGLVMQALIRACRQNPSLEAVVIGDGYARQACEQSVESAGLAGRIRFSGALPPAEVQQQLVRCQAILLMSDFEGLPVALLEAMALGLVPVVRRIPSGIPELVVHETTGLLVSEDPGEAAESLLRLMADQQLWRRCSGNARALVVERFSAQRSYQTWKELILSLPRRTASSTPLDRCRLRSLPRPDPLLLESYRRGSPLAERWRQQARTVIARLKHRIRENL